MSEKIVVPSEVTVALSQLRAESGGRHFLVLSYAAGSKNELTVIGRGPGFVEEAKQYMTENNVKDAFYAYLRTDHKVELASTTKYAFLDYTPDGIAPMRKALLSQHKSQIRELLQPISASIQASKLNELTEDAVMQGIGESSGTKSNVTQKAAFQAAAVDISRSAAAKEVDYIGTHAKSERPLQLKDESTIRSALKSVRADSDPINWALVGFSDTTNYKELELKGTGTNGVGELRTALDSTQPQYALFRTTEQIDKTTAVRFSFLRIVPTTLPPSKKAMIGTYGGFISELFKPYAFDFDYSDVHDFSEEEVHNKISGLSGVKNMSLTAGASSSSSSSSSSSKISHPLGALSSPGDGSAGPAAFISQPSGEIQLDDRLQAALKSIRSDAKSGEQTMWLVASKVANKDALELITSGTTSSVEDLKANFESSNCNFALLRVIDRIDNSDTVKFVSIRWQPESTPAMKKSAVATKLGLYQKVFHPFSTEFFIADKSELSDSIVKDKVQSSSGSKSNVVAK